MMMHALNNKTKVLNSMLLFTQPIKNVTMTNRPVTAFLSKRTYSSSYHVKEDKEKVLQEIRSDLNYHIERLDDSKYTRVGISKTNLQRIFRYSTRCKKIWC